MPSPLAPGGRPEPRSRARRSAPEGPRAAWPDPRPVPLGGSAIRRRSDVGGRLPRLFRGEAERWPALSRWSLDGLRARCAAREVTTYAIDDGELIFDPRAGLTERRLPLAAALDEIEGRGPLRHRVRARLGSELPELLRDVVVPPPLIGAPRLEIGLWVSGAGVRSRLHFDQPENLLVQIRGRKVVWLLSPRERRRLYPHPLRSPIAQFSRVDLATPDLDAFPRLRRARAWRCELAPGDALRIPGGWWHYIASDEPTVSVGLRWWRRRRWPLLMAADLYKRARRHVR